MTGTQPVASKAGLLAMHDINPHLIKISFITFAAVGASGLIVCWIIYRRVPLILKGAALLIILGFAALADMYYLEPNWIKTERVVIQDGRLAPLMQGLKIVHLTDLHTRQPPRYREKALVDKVNALKPDLIFITGDFLRDIGELNATTSLIRSLHASIGIFGVLGNTDHYAFNPDGLAAQLSSAGLDLLRNESRDIPLPGGKVLRLAGVDDPVSGKARLEKALARLPADEPVVLLAHSPDIFSKAVLAGVNLILVGHTHGGQVGIPLLVSMYKYANRYPIMQGIVTAGKSSMYINRGIGTTAYPVRFFCRPEIAVIEVRP